MSLRRRRALTAGLGALAAGGGLAAIGRYAGAIPPVITAADRDLATSTGRFVTRTGIGLLAHQAARHPDRNAIVAPGSVVVALAMAAAGATDGTRAELVTTLGEPSGGGMDPDVLVERLGILQRVLTVRSDGTEIRTAAALLVSDALNPHEAFLRSLETRLGARARRVGFSEATARDLNAWISEKTDGLIPDALPGFLPDTVVALVTAVFFKGRWLDGFDLAATRDKNFRAADGRDIRMPMMHADRSTLAYLRFGPIEAVRVPYRGDDFEIVLAMPATPLDTSMARWIGAATDADWSAILDPDRYGKTKVVLKLPRQSIEASADLRDAVRATSAFHPLMAGDLQMGRVCEEPLQVGQLEHKALVRMDEEGTVAAAATVMGMQIVSALPPAIRFDVDRPHLFAIRHVPTGTVVFAGYVAAPRPIT